MMTKHFQCVQIIYKEFTIQVFLLHSFLHLMKLILTWVSARGSVSAQISTRALNSAVKLNE